MTNPPNVGGTGPGLEGSPGAGVPPDDPEAGVPPDYPEAGAGRESSTTSTPSWGNGTPSRGNGSAGGAGGTRNPGELLTGAGSGQTGAGIRPAVGGRVAIQPGGSAPKPSSLSPPVSTSPKPTGPGGTVGPPSRRKKSLSLLRRRPLSVSSPALFALAVGRVEDSSSTPESGHSVEDGAEIHALDDAAKSHDSGVLLPTCPAKTSPQLILPCVPRILFTTSSDKEDTATASPTVGAVVIGSLPSPIRKRSPSTTPTNHHHDARLCTTATSPTFSPTPTPTTTTSQSQRREVVFLELDDRRPGGFGFLEDSAEDVGHTYDDNIFVLNSPEEDRTPPALRGGPLRSTSSGTLSTGTSASEVIMFTGLGLVASSSTVASSVVASSPSTTPMAATATSPRDGGEEQAGFSSFSQWGLLAHDLLHTEGKVEDEEWEDPHEFPPRSEEGVRSDAVISDAVILQRVV